MKVILTGRLGADAKETDKGFSFSLPQKNWENNEEKTLWVAAKEARFAPYLTLASQIFLQCLKTKWTREMVLVKPAVSHFLSFESEA